MDALTKSVTNTNVEESELRRGPWTIEEDTLLIHYIARHGDGQWNILAKQAGLKRTGKSCRLRWLNYLKPDIKRGNLTLEEQLLILELHSKWGNRWSKIAQQLPGRTDNEIKNYWRTRVQKQARQLKIDSNSNRFFDSIRHLNDQKNQIQNPSDHTLNLQYYSKPFSSSSNHGNYGNNEEIIQQHKEQLVLNGDYQMETCSYDPFSPLGFWENAEFDSQMAANDCLFEDSMVDNLWNLDKMV